MVNDKKQEQRLCIYSKPFVLVRVLERSNQSREKRSSIRRWGGLPVAMRLASKKDHGLLKKTKSLLITSKNMVREVGELSQSLQVRIIIPLCHIQKK
jgi:hypothetical protein